MTMKAEIYYDEMGTQYGEEEIPADMLEKAKEYRANMVEAIAETDEETYDGLSRRRRNRDGGS